MDSNTEHVSEHKKKYGQFFTSSPVAEFMAAWVAEKNPKRILDPAVGEGIFLKTIHKLLPKAAMTAYEIDSVMAERFQEECKFENTLYIEDYMKSESTQQYDGIICNPPYHRFQEIPDRKQIRQLFQKRYGVNLNGYCNASSYFLIKSIHELAPGGRCAYILPYEFLNTGYGKAVKCCLIKEGVLRQIIKFHSSVKVFEDVITTCCILLLEKSVESSNYSVAASPENLAESLNAASENKTADKLVAFSEIDSLEQLNWKDIKQRSAEIPIGRIDYDKKWLSYFLKDSVVTDRQYLIQLKRIGKVRRGIATGGNQFFALSKEMIEKYHLSDEVCIPCVTRSPDITEPVLNEQCFRHLYEDNKKMMLFNGENAHTKADYEYIRLGERRKVHQAYLTSHRNPWYTIEKRQAAPIWISVFGRDKIKVIRNEMMIQNLTSFHGIYIEDESYSKEDINLLFCWLLTPAAQAVLKESRREYGNGLNKFEPGDLMDAYVLDVKQMRQQDRKKMLEYYDRLFRPDDGEDDFNDVEEYKGINRIDGAERVKRTDQDKEAPGRLIQCMDRIAGLYVS